MITRALAVGFASLALTGVTGAQECDGRWAADRFPIAGFDNGVSTSILWDDGTGASLYVGGRFLAAGSEIAGGMARWDEGSWQTVGGGVDGDVRTLAVFDDGTGPALYAGGNFTAAGGVAASNIARWDGTQWMSVGNGLNDSVQELIVYDDGTGPALYAGGWFTQSDQTSVSHLARWNGTEWSMVGSGIGVGTGTNVSALATFDDGSGNALYVAGAFSVAGGTPVRNIVRWDGVTWSDVGGGTSSASDAIFTMSTLDGMGGPTLVVGGDFSDVGGSPARNVAMWDGTAWSRVGEGFDDLVFELAAVEQDGVDRLYAGGRFRDSGDGTRPLNGIARWNGFWWEAIGDFLNPGVDRFVSTIEAFPGGPDAGIFIGGGFDRFEDGRPAKNAAILNRGQFSSIGDGVDAPVSVLLADGPHLYAGGMFTRIGGIRARSVARFDGTDWRALGDGLEADSLSSPVNALAIFDDGGGADLYAGGRFTRSGSRDVRMVARWDPSTSRWESLADTLDGNVLALAVYDDGAARHLFAAGNFRIAGGSSGSAIARWDGTAWNAVGPGLSGTIHDLVTFDDGSGEALYAAGRFTIRPDLNVVTIGRWDGAGWTSLSDGIDVSSSVQLTELAVFDDGSGEALYAAGGIEGIDGQPADGLIRWDGTSWVEVGGGVRRGAFGSGRMTDLVAADDGQGEALFISGDFGDAGGLAVRRIAKWDGAEWSSMDGGTVPDPITLVGYDDGEGPALWAGGNFTYAGAAISSFLGRWRCDPLPCSADIDGDGELTVFDFLDFQNLFYAGSAAADFDGDGELTLFDFLDFQTLFALGC